MKSHFKAAAIASTLLIAAPAFSNVAAAQPVPGGSSGSTLVPVVIGAAAGATVGALLWPVFMPATAVVAAAPGAVAMAPGAVAMAPEAATWGWGAFMTTRALVGAVIGGGLGYLSAR